MVLKITVYILKVFVTISTCNITYPVGFLQGKTNAKGFLKSMLSETEKVVNIKWGGT